MYRMGPSFPRNLFAEISSFPWNLFAEISSFPWNLFALYSGLLCSALFFPYHAINFYPDVSSEDGTWLCLLLFLLNLLQKEWQWNPCLFPVFILLLPLARNVHAHFPPGFVGEHAFIRSRVRKIECYVWHIKCIWRMPHNGIDLGSPYETDTTQRTPRLCSVCPLRSGKATVICYTRPLCLPIIYSARVRFHWLEIEYTYYWAFALVLFSSIPPIIQRLRTSSKKGLCQK